MPYKHKFYNLNILTPNYCNLKKFPKNKKEYLDNNTRFDKIKKELVDKMKNGYIITLQEVCREWDCMLKVLFDSNKYKVVSSLYGERKNGYMGVLIAYPNSYKLENCKISRLSDTIIFPKRRNNYCEIFMNKLRLLELNDYSYLRNAQLRKNTVIGLKLSKNDEPSFWVFNYHMPCSWKQPIVMVIHSILLERFITQSIYDFKLRSIIPCILLGDFNSNPLSLQYKYFTSGENLESIRNLLLNEMTSNEIGPATILNLLEQINYTDNLIEFDIFKKKNKVTKFKSVYKDFYDSEPVCTNHAYCAQNGPFIGTLDYIFVTDKIKVVSVENLDNNKHKRKYMPNEWLVII